MSDYIPCVGIFAPSIITTIATTPISSAYLFVSHFSLLQCVRVCVFEQDGVYSSMSVYDESLPETTYTGYTTAWSQHVCICVCKRESITSPSKKLNEYQWPCLSKRGQICTPFHTYRVKAEKVSVLQDAGDQIQTPANTEIWDTVTEEWHTNSSHAYTLVLNLYESQWTDYSSDNT